MTVITDETLDAALRAAQDAANGTSGTGVRHGLYEKQKGIIYDLLCAGPIEGLVGGLSGVYLNDTALIDDSEESLALLSKEGTCSANNSSTTLSSVVDSNNTGLFTGLSTSDLNNNARYVQIKGAGKSSTLSAAIYENQQRIVVADNNTFSSVQTRKVTGTATDLPNSIYDPVAYSIRIPGAAGDGGEYIGIITGVASDGSGTNNAAFIYPPIGAGVASGTDVKIDHVSKISSITNVNTCVLETAPTTTNSSAAIKLSPALPTKTTSTGAAKLNYENAGAVVYPGTRYQPSHDIPGTEASASYMISPNHDLKWHTSNDPSSGQSTYFVNAGAFSFTQNTKEEVDRVVLALEFPGGLSNTTDEGKDRIAHAEFQIVLEYKVDANASDYTKILIAGKNYGGSDFTQSVPSWSNVYKTQTNNLYAEGGTRDSSNQTGIANGLIKETNQKVKFIKEFEIDLTPFQPLEDWRIGVKRLSPDSTADYTVDQHTFIGRTILKSAEAIVEEKLRFPLSAYAIVGFTAEDFATPPQRAYHIRGKKVKVPTNYFTREETGSNQAKYTRNKTTGADTSAYVTWDGTFRGDLESNTPAINQSKVYTNNPAWIFYDILTDREIGLGEFIDEADIDKYALYQIARHCDELVPDGKGGTEPRFSCNVYFKKQTEAYKVLKDLASSFRGMLYWIDGQLTPVQDTLKEPVYTFTNGNVEEGMFNYAYTGQQARTNQINVSWSNPDENYKQTILTIEDTPNILSQDRIISKDVVAFGCTSEGQARRVGMWHLLTDTQETEILTFATGINASFLRPGDFINVQDHYADSIIASGRLNTGTSTTVVILDREIGLTGYSSGSSHVLYLVYPEPGVYLAQNAEATINGVLYKRGGLITADTNGNPITTASGVANLVDDSGNAVTAQFSKNTRIEKRYISNANGNSTNSITVSSAFSSTPDADVIWAIGPDEEYANTDIRQFRIIGIAEEGQGEKYNISATEIAIDKYDGVDSHRKVVIPDYSTASNSDKEIPYPENISVELVPAASPAIDAAETSIEALISWSNPTEDFVDTGGTTTSRDYRFANRFEIQHNFIKGNLPDSLSEVVVPASRNSVRLPNITAGKYKVKIRTVSDSGAKSKWNSVNRTLVSPPPNLNRVSRIARGGTLTTSLDFDYTNGKLLFEEENYSYIAPSSYVLGISSATTAQKEQSFNSMSNNTTAYLYYDHSAAPSDPWKAVQVHTDNVAQDSAGLLINFNYFKEVGVANNGLASTSGTVSITAGGTVVTGSSTTFTSDFSEGALIKITAGSTVGTQVATTEYFEVAEVISNTLLYVKRSATRTFSGSYAMKQSLTPDFGEDAILAVVQKGSSGSYAAEFFVNSRGKRGAGRWQVPVTSLPTTSAAAQTAWDTNWTNRPGSPVVGDQAIFFEGTEANQTGQSAWTYDGGAWQQQAEVIDGDLVVTGSITTDKIFANAITAEKIAANQITANEITTNSIQAIHVGADVINANHIAAGEITTAALAADAITADKIAAGAVTADSVAANSIVATLIDATTVSAADISTNTLSALSANLGNITAGTLKNSGANSIPDANSAPSGAEKGAHIDLTAGKFVFGSASKHILWDGTDLTLSGVVVDSSSTVNAPAGLGTIKEDGNTDGTNITSLNFTTGLNVAVSGSEATIHVDATTSSISEGSRLYFTNTRADARVNAVHPDTDALSEGSSNLYFTNARARSAMSGSDNGGLGSFSYNSSTGAYTYTGPSNSDIRGLFSHTDTGGDGSFSYNSSTGVFTYTGPSASEVRAHFAGGNGLTLSSGTFAVGQGDGISVAANSIAVDSSVVRTSGTQTINGNKTFGNNIVVSGNLTVSGTTTTINTETVNIADNIIVLNSNFTGSSPTENAGIEVERGTQANKTFVWKESNDRWSFGSESVEAATFYGSFIGSITGSPSSLAGLSTDDLAEGSSNLYFTNGRAQAAISAGDGLGKSGGTLFVNAGSGISVSSDQVNVSGVTTAMLAGSALQTSGESFSDSNSVLMTAAAIQDKILSYGYTTNTGDITGITIGAGSGLTGGGTDNSGAVNLTLNVGAGSGISVAADSVAVDSTVLRTTTSFGGDVSGTYGAIVVANDSHTHDSRYYTESEVNSLLGGKQNASTPLGYIDTATGNYGTIKVDDDRGVSWAGYAIRDDWVFMSNGAGAVGIYNDTDNEWALYAAQNGAVSIYHNGSSKIATSSTGATITGVLSATGGNSTNWNTAYGWGNHASQGYLTGNQTITLGGDVSGSGTTSITVTVANDSHTHDTRYYTESEVNTLLAGKQNTGSYLTGNQTITLSGDATGSGTTSIAVSLAANSVGASEIAANAVGASELNVSGNGSAGQALLSDGDGTFTWGSAGQTYTGSNGITLVNGTDFQLSNNATGDWFVNSLTADTIDACHITASTISARELTISANADSTANSMFFNNNGSIRIYDSNSTLRVKVGNLA
jgi:predicted phage tail protein